jgi:hypothetical protein
MTRKPSLLLAAFAVMALALAAAGGASAKFPKFKNHLIVPGKSIGGVKVGMTKKQAVKAWGRPDLVDTVAFKGYAWYRWQVVADVVNGVKIFNEVAGFYVRHGKVTVVNIGLPEDPVLGTRLTGLKTSKGIGLRGSMADARSKYGIPKPPPGEATESRANLKKGKRCTLFYAPEKPWDSIRYINVGLCGALPGGFST